MKIIKFGSNQASISIERDELLLIHAALNEICNGIEVFEFETRTGVDKTRALNFLSEVGSLLDSVES
ncbi:hypothetical protein JWR97_05950 [Pseudomonas cedrina subsp. fulgida]|nr:hypothetical protein [Pseudomonas cedrina subsp. fulgida]